MSATARTAIPIALPPKAAAFVQSKKLKRGFVGGRGCSKSWTLSYDFFKKAKRGRLYMVLAPAYKTLSDSTYRTFMEVGERYLDRIVQKRSGGGNLWAKVSTFDPDANQSQGFAEVIFRSTSDPDSLRGPNLSGALFDEASVSTKESFDTVFATLREGGEMGWITLGFTPKGRTHWTYREFFDDFGRPKPHTELFISRQSENPFLHEMFIEAMKSQYGIGTKLARQEIEGEFVDIEGLLFKREWFTANNHVIDDIPFEGIRVRYWDKASTSIQLGSDSENKKGCFTVGVLMSMNYERNKFFIEDVVRGQWSYAERNRIIRQTAELDAIKYNNTVTIWIEMEGGSGGKESAEVSVADLAGFPVILDRPHSNASMRALGLPPKMTRALAFSAQAELGNVYMKFGEFNEILLDELASFPEGLYADQVDACSGSFNKLALNGIMNSSYQQLLVYPYAPEKQLDYKNGIPQNFIVTPSRDRETADLLNFLSRDRSAVRPGVRIGTHDIDW